VKPLTILLILSACGSVEESTPDAGAIADGPPAGDAITGDATAARCDLSKPFAAATLVPNVNTSNDEYLFTTTRDELYGFVSYVVQSSSSATILTTSRRSTGDSFGMPNGTVTEQINKATGSEYGPSPVSDGLLMYFHRQTTANIGIYAASRAVGGVFNLGNTVSVDGKPLLNALSATISADGMTLYWLDFNDFKLHSATRGATPTIFTGNTEVSTMAIPTSAVLSADELTLFYTNNTTNGDILEATRASKSVPFGIGVPVANVNSPQSDYPTHLSHDGCVLYIISTRAGGVGGPDVWQAQRPQ
jgi:hypothetical protein